jgi:hypothetical protein
MEVAVTRRPNPRVITLARTGQRWSASCEVPNSSSTGTIASDTTPCASMAPTTCVPADMTRKDTARSQARPLSARCQAP